MRYFEPSAEQLQGWEEWTNERPAEVAVLARRFPPWELFKLKESGNRVFARSFQEMEGGGVTMTVAVRREFNPDVLFERDVFGIAPESTESLSETLGELGQ